MEDTQNNAPGSLPSAQAAKLGAGKRAPDSQSTTKRYVYSPTSRGIHPPIKHDKAHEQEEHS